MKKILISLLMISVLLVSVGFVMARGGFNEWGYNYQANIFNGMYCDAYEDATWCQPHKDIKLQMKWSDEWLNEDRVRCAGTSQEGSSACEGAWLTNHQRETYEDEETGKTCTWEWFLKIVYIDGEESTCDDLGGKWLWGAYCEIQSIYNDPCAGEYGVEIITQPMGFGAY